MDLMSARRGLLELITHTTGGDPIPAGVEIGLFTPETDENTHTITHNLGQVPKTAYCFAVANGAAWPSLPPGMILAEELASDPETGVFDITLAGAHKRNNVIVFSKTTAAMQFNQTSTHTTYPASMTDTTVTFTTGRYYDGKLSAGITYIYILTK